MSPSQVRALVTLAASSYRTQRPDATPRDVVRFLFRLSARLVVRAVVARTILALLEVPADRDLHCPYK